MRDLWLLQSACSQKLTFRYNEDSSRRLKKTKCSHKKLETATTCWTRAGRNFGTRPETGFGSWQRVRRTLPSSARCSAGHCWEGQRPVFVSSLPRVLLLAPLYPLRYTPSLSLPPRVPPFLPLSTLIVFPSDKDLITHREDLEPEPHSERKRAGQPIRHTSGKQLAHGAVKAPCVSV